MIIFNLSPYITIVISAIYLHISYITDIIFITSNNLEYTHVTS